MLFAESVVSPRNAEAVHESTQRLVADSDSSPIDQTAASADPKFLNIKISNNGMVMVKLSELELLSEHVNQRKLFFFLKIKLHFTNRHQCKLCRGAWLTAVPRYMETCIYN